MNTRSPRFASIFRGSFLRLLFFTAAALHGISMASDGRQSTVPDAHGNRYFDLEADPVFKEYRKKIDQLVTRTTPSPSANDFCTLGMLSDDQSRQAFIIWQQGAKIYLWEGQDGPLEESRRVIDLKRDVVKSQRYLHGSSYLVTAAWVSQLKKSCSAHGSSIKVNASPR